VHLLAHFLGAAGDNLDSIGRNILIIKLEICILQDKSPHLVARAINIQITLSSSSAKGIQRKSYLECKSTFDVGGEFIRDGFVKLKQSVQSLKEAAGLRLPEL
jgi:hypothetical protein